MEVKAGSQLIANELRIKHSDRLKNRIKFTRPDAPPQITLGDSFDTRLVGVFLFIHETQTLGGSEIPGGVITFEPDFAPDSVAAAWFSREWGKTSEFMEALGLRFDSPGRQQAAAKTCLVLKAWAIGDRLHRVKRREKPSAKTGPRKRSEKRRRS